MTEKPLGRLEKVDLRDQWRSEAGEFTPWLARDENVALLGEVIGLELEVEALERNVGRFYADILCKDTANGHWVLIENQLERTDHAHLGQLMTYAAGLDAVTIVWIAARFTEEHRAALDWLNDITDDRFNFFGIEVELWRIGDSLAAPKFSLVSKPNDWTKSVAGAARGIASSPGSEAQALQLDFWTGFKAHLEEAGSPVKPTKPLPQNWMWMSIGRTGFGLSAALSTWNHATQTYGAKALRAELSISHRASKAFYEYLQAERVAIEQDMGEALQWYSKDDVKTCRIYVETPAEFENRERWPEQFAWLRLKLEALGRVFRERIRRLDDARWAPEAVPGAE